MTRPGLLVGMVGTATEVGKTWVGAALLSDLRAAGRTVAARKPLQSHDPADGLPTDAEVLAAATGEPVEVVCPPSRTLPVPMAPPMAGAVLGRPIPTTDEVLAGLAWPPGLDVGLIETVGGVRSPMTSDGDSLEVIRAAAVDVVVLVADAGLGTVNGVRLCVQAMAGLDVVVVLNRFGPADDLHRRNRAWLVERDGLHVVVSVADLARSLTR